MKIVEFWAKGYANQDGPSRLIIEDDADAASAVRKASGPCAVMFSVRPQNPPKVAPVSAEYARMMSQNDNS